MIEYVYCIYDEGHGLMSIWTDEVKARTEVDRISTFYDNIEADDWFNGEGFYGNDMVYYKKVKVNADDWED